MRYQQPFSPDNAKYLHVWSNSLRQHLPIHGNTLLEVLVGKTTRNTLQYPETPCNALMTTALSVYQLYRAIHGVLMQTLSKSLRTIDGVIHFISALTPS